MCLLLELFLNYDVVSTGAGPVLLVTQLQGLLRRGPHTAIVELNMNINCDSIFLIPVWSLVRRADLYTEKSLPLTTSL